MTLKHTRRRVGIWRGEVLDAVTTEKDGRRTYYSYTYKVAAAGRWMPQVRWDNSDGEPHVDKYDETGTLKERAQTVEKRLDDVLGTVRLYRRELLTIPASEL